MKIKTILFFSIFFSAFNFSVFAVRELQTIYSVGNYRVKTGRAFGLAVNKRALEDPIVKKAFNEIKSRAEAATLIEKVEINPLTVGLKQARENNKENVKIARYIFDSAIIYCAKNDKKYFNSAVKLFNAFVDKFNPERQTGGINASHQYHLLYARDWLPYLAKSYDLLFNSLTVNQKKKFAGWLIAMTDVISENAVWEKWKNTTHGAWQSVALATVGNVTKNKKLVALAKSRILYQLNNMVGSDGLWLGGSLAINYTATRAFLTYAEIMLNSQSNPYKWKNNHGESYIHKMINAPLMFIDALGTIPGSDNLKTGLPPGDIYLIGAIRYRDQLYGAIMKKNVAKISDEDLLIYYINPQVDVNITPRPLHSIVSPSMGWGILRINAENPLRSLFARLDYGPHGGSSGNADKLDLYFCGYGRRVISTGGSYPVNSPLRFGWTKQTLSHNTVVINYQSQVGAKTPSDPHGVPGKLLLFDYNDTINVIEADAKNSYPNVPLTSYRRCVALLDDYILDIFTISAAKPVTADWVVHGLGKKAVVFNAIKGECSLNNPIAREGLLGSNKDGYNWIDDVNSYTANEQWSVIWTSGLKTIMMGQPGTRIMLGKSGGNVKLIGDNFISERNYDEHSLIVRRQNILETRFVAIHEILTTNVPKIKSFARLETGTDALILEIITDYYKDIFVLQPKRVVKEFMIDEHHLVSMNARRYAYLRIRLKDNEPIKQINLTVNETE